MDILYLLPDKFLTNNSTSQQLSSIHDWSYFSFILGLHPVRNKSKLHSSSATHRRKQEDMKKEIEEKKKEFSNSEKIAEIYKLAEEKQVH